MKINIGGQKGRKSIRHHDYDMVDIREGAEHVVDVAFEPLPFEDGTVEAIYTSHTLEHILPERIRFVFLEMFRVLEPEGRIRIVVPDIDIALKAYVDNPKWLSDPRNPGKMKILPNFPVMRLASWFFTYYSRATKTACKEDVIFGGHMMVYNQEVLDYFLRKAGFSNRVQMSCNNSSDMFQGCDNKRYAANSLFMEARKICHDES